MVRRLLVSSFILIGFMLVSLGVPFWKTIVASERADLRTDLERDAVVLSTLVEDLVAEPGDPEKVPQPAKIRSIATGYSQRTGARVVIVDANGDTLADNESPAESKRSFASRPEIVTALGGSVGVDQRFSHTLGRSALFVATPISSGGHILGAVRLSYTTADLDHRIRLIGLRFATAAAIAAVTATALAFIMARSLGKPLTQLRAATQAFGAGSLTTRAPTINGAPELRALGTDFNAMADRVEELVKVQDAFVADASHQLRSPLTAARLQVESLSYLDPTAGTTFDDAVEAAVGELDRLSRIVDGLLELARFDRGEFQPPVLALRPALMDRVEFWSAFAAERQIDVHLVPGSGNAHARVDPDRLAQILDNLIANAIDACSADGEVAVSVTATNDHADIFVDDTGTGMTDAQLERAFDRLWRADGKRTDLSGSGLGLPIARKLARADHGELRLERRPPSGIRAVLSYPVDLTSPRR